MQLPPDAPLSDQLAVLFGQMSRAVARHPGPLTRTEYALVASLEHAGPQRVCDLASADGLDASTASRRVTALVDRGLLVRAADPEDGRAQRVEVTGTGRMVLADERRRRAALVTDVLDGWPEADRADLSRLLARLHDSLARAAGSTERTPA